MSPVLGMLLRRLSEGSCPRKLRYLQVDAVSVLACPRPIHCLNEQMRGLPGSQTHLASDAHCGPLTVVVPSFFHDSLHGPACSGLADRPACVGTVLAFDERTSVLCAGNAVLRTGLFICSLRRKLPTQGAAINARIHNQDLRLAEADIPWMWTAREMVGTANRRSLGQSVPAMQVHRPGTHVYDKLCKYRIHIMQ